MAITRVLRTLSAFNPSTLMWAPISSKNAWSQVTQTLSLTSWNIDAFSPRTVSRAKLILDHILEGPNTPDIIFLQEVSSDVRATLLRDQRVRSAFLTTDAEDETSFEQVPFATMTLLSSARLSSGLDPQKEVDKVEGRGRLTLGPVTRVPLPSKYGRDALCVDMIPSATPNMVIRLINVHLDSLGHTLHYRAQQIGILADILREPGCGSGIIAGDFNAISPEDDELIEKNNLVDAWVALHGGNAGGATWSVGVERRDRFGPRRLDKVVMMGLKATKIETLRPGFIEVPRPGKEPLLIPWSDHCGLKCTFAI